MNKTTSGEQSNLLKDDENLGLEQPAIRDENEEAKKKQRMKCIGISIGIAVAIAILVVILVLVLKKSSSPDNPDGPPGAGVNPFNVVGVDPKPNGHGLQHFYLQKDPSNTKADYLQTGGNSFISNVTCLAQLMSYESAAVYFYESNHFHNQYHVPSEYFSDDYDAEYQKGIFFNHLGFQVSYQTQFYMRLYNRDTKEDYVTTKDQPFLTMKYYSQIGYKIESQRLFGFGERTRDFKLGEGTYVLYPQVNPGKVDDGSNKEPMQQAGQHPFLMAQLKNKTFFGIYIANSNAQQITIKQYTEQVVVDDKPVTKQYSNVIFTANGGALDTYYFFGPTYQDVLRQYHKLIGKPILPPLHAHGLFMSNDDLYQDPQALDSLIGFCKGKNISLEGVVIPPQMTDNQYQFSLGYQSFHRLEDLHAKYPNVKWVYPFSPHIPMNYKPASMTGKNLAIEVNGNLVQVTDSVKGDGYCFDYFNYNATQYLEKIFSDAKLDFTITGFWLYHNTPAFSKTNYTGSSQSSDVNPFKDLPFWPGQKDKTYSGTLPPYSRSHIEWDGQNLTDQYQFYLHGLFGSEMASKIQLAASEHSAVAQALVVSESTYPGAGAKGIAHVFPKQALSTQALRYAVAQLFNFNMFGIPYASPNICGYYRGTGFTAETENLCIRSFQLAVVTPFAVYNTNGSDITSLSEKGQLAVRNNLEARMSLIMYQRTELYKISHIGGALIRPLFTEYDYVPDFTPDTVDTVMFGESLKVDFMFTADIADKTVHLPPHSLWLEIFAYELVAPSVDGGTTKNMTTSLNYPIILQKEGSIIPIQRIIVTGARSTSGLRNTPMRLSILLDQHDFKASGHVLIEDGKGEYEFYEVKATRDSISFKQQNEGSVSDDFKTKQIEMIRVAAKPMTFGTKHVACAVLQDHQTVKQMYVRTFHNDQLEITARDPDNKEDKTTIAINQVAFIYYGVQDPSSFKCDQSIMQGKVKLDVLKGDYTREVVVSQNVQKLVSSAPDLNFVVTLEDDNTLYVSWFPQTAEGETQRRLQEESEPQGKPRLGKPSYKLENLVTVNTDPFYIEVHSYIENPTDPKTVYWTTKDASFIFGHDYSMLTFFQPNTDPDKFFGIGERKGDFFLQDNYQYSMHTNNKNLKDIQQGSRTVQFCKNGFFPLIFARDAKNGAKMMATYLTEGSKDIFFTKKFGSSSVPKISVVQMVNHMGLRLIYDQLPVQLMRDTHRNLYNPEYLRVPAAWALGQYHLVRNFEDSGEFTSHVDFYKKIGWPLEGFVLDLNFTDYSSLRLSPTKIEGGNYNFTIQYLNQRNLTLWQIMKAGIPKHTQQANYLIQNNTCIAHKYSTMFSSPVTGLDQEGEVVYANYYDSGFSLTEYQESAFAHYERTYLAHTYGVQLIHNEIYEPFSSNDYTRDSQFDPMPEQFYKVGIDAQLRNSLFANSPKNIDTHNGYAYRQQLRLSRADSKKQKFFISSSNTPGSGKLGNVGRWIDYVDFTDEPTATVQALQSLSIMGMGAIGEKFGSVHEKVGEKVVNQHITIQTFSPLAAHQWLQPDPKGTDDLMAGPLVRYKYMMIKYTQALLFKQAYLGDPLIHPLFFDFYDDETTFNSDVVKNQYMYGDFMVSIKANVKGENTYFPKSTWCTTHNYNADPFCFNSTGISTQVQQRLFYFQHGSILPLQDVFGKEHNVPPANTTKDLVDYPIDLHINPNVMTGLTQNFLFSDGAMLFTSDGSDTDPYCYVNIIHRDDHINFEMEVGRDIFDCHYPGYKAGRLYIYNPSQFSYKNVMINGDSSLVDTLHPGVNEHYSYFDLSTMHKDLNWYDVYLIQFS